MSDKLTPEVKRDIAQNLYDGQRISAIAHYRQCTGGSLAEAKGFIDELEETLRRHSPEKFKTSGKKEPTKVSSFGCLGILAVMLGLGYLTYWIHHNLPKGSLGVIWIGFWGCGLFLFGLWYHADRMKWRSRGKEVKGTIMDIITTQGLRGQRSRSALIYFMDDDNNVHELRHQFVSFYKSIDDTIDLIYVPENPKKVFVKNSVVFLIPGLVTAGFGLGLLCVAWKMFQEMPK